MRQPAKTLIPATIALIVGLLLVGALVWAVTSVLASMFSSLDPNVISALIAGLTGVLLVMIGQYFNRSREISEAHRDMKVEMYKKFVQMQVNMLQNVKKDPKYEMEKDQNVIQILIDLQRDLILWSSPKAIQAFLEFRTRSGEDPRTVMLKVDKLLRAMREDMGLSNRGMPEGQLVKIFLSDPEELDRMLRR